jgi:hypothetical protein
MLKAAPRTILAMTAMASAHLLGQATDYDVSSINGGYAYNIGGSATDPISGDLTRVAEAGRLTANGAGNMNGTDSVMVAGSLIRRTFTGTYTINPDGTGAFVLNPSWGPPIHADFVAGESGRILRLVLTDYGNTISGLMEAQQAPGQAPPPPGFSAVALNGSYDYRIGGSGVDFFGNVIPIREIGRLTTDGAGNITGSSTVSLNGQVVKRTLSGVYFINADGSGTATLYPSWGPPIDMDLFVSASGLKAEFVVTDYGNTLSGAMTADALPSPAIAAARPAQ